MKTKPPYTVAYMLRMGKEERLSPDEVPLLQRIDELTRAIRSAELLGLKVNIFPFVEKHVQASYEYYSNFNEEDMATLFFLEELGKALAENGKEDE